MVSRVSPSTVIGAMLSASFSVTPSPTMSMDIAPGGIGLSLALGSIEPTGKLYRIDEFLSLPAVMFLTNQLRVSAARNDGQMRFRSSAVMPSPATVIWKPGPCRSMSMRPVEAICAPSGFLISNWSIPTAP